MNTRVRDLLRDKGTEVLTTPPDVTVYEAIKKMVDHNVGSIVAVEGAKIEGMFTERDYLRRIVLQGRSSKTTPLHEVMTKEVYTVPYGATVQQCMALMTEHKFRHLPVVDDGALCGIISIGDCVRHLSEEAQAEVNDLKNYIAGQYPG
jgi:CBS domain-containing protein